MLILEKVLVLRGTTVFSGVREEFLAEIAQRGAVVELAAGEVLFSQGELGTSLYVVVSGRLRASVGATILGELGEREIVGEMAALDPEPRSATITAVEPTTLLRVGHQDLNVVMAGDVDVARGIITMLCRRLRRATSPT